MKTEAEIRQAMDDIIMGVSVMGVEMSEAALMTAHSSLSALAWVIGSEPLSHAFDRLIDGLRGEQVQRELDT